MLTKRQYNELYAPPQRRLLPEEEECDVTAFLGAAQEVLGVASQIPGVERVTLGEKATTLELMEGQLLLHDQGHLMVATCGREVSALRTALLRAGGWAALNFDASKEADAEIKQSLDLRLVQNLIFLPIMTRGGLPSVNFSNVLVDNPKTLPDRQFEVRRLMNTVVNFRPYIKAAFLQISGLYHRKWLLSTQTTGEQGTRRLLAIKRGTKRRKIMQLVDLPTDDMADFAFMQLWTTRGEGQRMELLVYTKRAASTKEGQARHDELTTLPYVSAKTKPAEPHPLLPNGSDAFDVYQFDVNF